MTKRKSNASEESARDLPLTKPVRKAMTVDQIISAGENAAATLGSPAVNVAVSLMREKLYQQIACSHPKETQARESAYLQLHALGDMLNELHGLYQEAKVRVEEIQQKPQREQAEFYDQQGFG